jgi:hypothetical protein
MTTHPRTEFAPARFCAVGKNAHNRIGKRVPQPRGQENGRRRARGDSENVRVKTRLKKNHRHEDEVRGGVGGAITGFFNK